VLFSESGGLVYHARAWRLAGTLWLPFREAIAEWLARQLPVDCERERDQELVLVGPSAGHCLPLQHLAQFRRVLLLEPDPVARWLLTRRLRAHQPQIVIESEPRDELLAPLLTGAPGLEQVLERRPRAALLFCNVLGQLHFGLDDAQQARFEQAFRERVVPQLAGRDWASFHDRWSLDWEAQQPLPGSVGLAARPTDDELAQRCFGAEGPPVEVLDHGTAQLFPAELPRRYLPWRITDSALHVVEALPAP
jgi:hypothetical protein